jgi:hypothetical protein
MLETISNVHVIKVVTSMQLPDGRNLVEDGRLFSQAHRDGGCHLFCSAGRRQQASTAQQVATTRTS